MAPVTRARSKSTKPTNLVRAQTEAFASTTKIRKQIRVPVSSQSTTRSKSQKSTSKPGSHELRPTDLHVLAFETSQAFSTFLSSNSSTSPGIWLKLARANSGIPSVTTQEAIEVALCHGWINGQGKKLPGTEGEDWYLARYTPRRAKSTWSQVNVELVERLIEEGRMQPGGLAAINAAKADGRWDRAYARPTDITEPQDFLDCLNREGNEASKAFYESLSKGRRYKVLVHIEMSSPTARAKRIENMVTRRLANKQVPGEKDLARNANDEVDADV